MNPFQYSFEEALGAARKGKSIRRERWSNDQYIIHAVFERQDDKFVPVALQARDSLAERFWTPGTDDLFATDWGIF